MARIGYQAEIDRAANACLRSMTFGAALRKSGEHLSLDAPINGGHAPALCCNMVAIWIAFGELPP